MSYMRIPEAVIAERDARAFELRKMGLSYRRIASALDISESTAHAGVQRVLQKIGRQLAENNGDVLRMELERLDQLMSQIWPLTRERKLEIRDADGNPSEITLPPDLDAVDKVVKLMDRRAKLLGMDSITIQTGGGGSGGPMLGHTEKAGEVSPKEEAMELLKVMFEAGVLDKSAMAHIQAAVGEVVDAEVIEDEEPPAIGTGD
jgi:hypothetical protein